MPTVTETFCMRPAMGDWSMLAGRADEWFRAYLVLSLPINTQRVIPASPLTFSAGHAVELYLKAAVTAVESLAEAAKFRHKMRALWEKCENLYGFPLKGHLDLDLLDQTRDIYSMEARNKLSAAQQIHLAENEALYLAIRHVQDLKYLGTKGPTLKGNYHLTFGLVVPDRTMIGHLLSLSRWCWGQWWRKPGYTDSALPLFAQWTISEGMKPPLLP
jgi:hypothetical protein